MFEVARVLLNALVSKGGTPPDFGRDSRNGISGKTEWGGVFCHA